GHPDRAAATDSRPRSPRTGARGPRPPLLRRKEPAGMSDNTPAAAEDTPDHLPAGPGATPDPVQRGERRGMFGVTGGDGDTSGFGGQVTPTLFPGAAVRPYGGYFDEVADALEAALGGESFAES